MAGSNGRADPGGNRLPEAGGGAGGTAAEPPLHETIPSDFAAGFAVQQRILAAAQRQGFGSEELFALKIATEEALVNAIKHGNKLDKAKMVHIDATVTSDRVRVEIEDQGEGFDRASIADPLADENLEKPSGRGILLIESYMTDVSWTHGGRRLHMEKRRMVKSEAQGSKSEARNPKSE